MPGAWDGFGDPVQGEAGERDGGKSDIFSWFVNALVPSEKFWDPAHYPFKLDARIRCGA